jgi:hypothetical protein
MPVIGLLRLQLVAAVALLVAFAQPLRAADV